MMLWPGAHRRFREGLSAYLDGELEAAAAERLDAHLAACDGCRLELDQLRATATALRDLPAVEAPRSFALSPEATRLGVSPERVPRRREPPLAAAPLALGMRLAAAGVAVALAAVLVVDLGGLSGDNQPGTAPQTATQRDAEYAAPTDSAAAPDVQGEGTPPAGEAFGEDKGAVTPSHTSEAERPALTDDSGIDALRAAEIALGVTLALLLLGGLALAFTVRKT